jgi:hypothetical protein
VSRLIFNRLTKYALAHIISRRLALIHEVRGVTKEGKEYLEPLFQVRVHMVRINYCVITADKWQKDFL